MLIALPSTSTTREPLTFAFATYHQTLSSVCSYEMMLLRGSYHYDFLVLHIFVYIIENINIKLLNTCWLFDLKKSQDRHSMDDSLQSCHQIQAGWLEGSSKAPKRNYNGKETECCESRWKQTSRTNENKWKDFLKQSLHREPLGHCTLVLTHHCTPLSAEIYKYKRKYRCKCRYKYRYKYKQKYRCKYRRKYKCKGR